MLKKIFQAAFIICFLVPQFVYGYSDKIYAGGQNIGIELNSKGVMVTGFYKVSNNYIASDSGLMVGDIITTVNSVTISNIEDLVNSINNSNGVISIGYIRGNMTKYTNLSLVKEGNTYKTGIYVKDSITGIGTLTYIDPETKLFGALGHEITESNTGKVLDITDGKIYSSKVIDIVPSTSGNPGEKNASIDSSSQNGVIFENTVQGIFGNYTDDLSEMKLYEVGSSDDITKGIAMIRTVIDGNTIEEYSINITKIVNGDTKNLLFEITDDRLLNITGGIVQGMSGSPIIQNDKIIGAVTHVLVDNPKLGYGIFITNMLEQAEN